MYSQDDAQPEVNIKLLVLRISYGYPVRRTMVVALWRPIAISACCEKPAEDRYVDWPGLQVVLLRIVAGEDTGDT